MLRSQPDVVKKTEKTTVATASNVIAITTKDGRRRLNRCIASEILLEVLSVSHETSEWSFRRNPQGR